MERDLIARTGHPDPRRQMDLDDYSALSGQADEYGIFQFVLTGGEAILDKQIEPLIERLDPSKHLIILDTNGWHFNESKAAWFADVGGCKAQISLDSFYENGTTLSKQKGILQASNEVNLGGKKAELELLVSCIVKDRVFSQEFEELLRFCQEECSSLRDASKTSWSAREHSEWVCSKPMLIVSSS